ncbi:MAG: hypothetical protein LQ341_006502, partial [Variospora aurantia]
MPVERIQEGRKPRLQERWIIAKVVCPGSLTTTLDALFTVYGPGTQCWKFGGGARATNIGWFYSQSLHVKARGGEAPASVSAEDKECSPHSAKEAEVVVKHVEDGNKTALAEFEE